MPHRPVRMGVIGLGRAFTLMLPTFVRHPDVTLVACADPRMAARECFARDFGGEPFETIEALLAKSDVDALYLATPHQFHVTQVQLAARFRKHVLVEKPLALRLDDCRAMISAADAVGIHVVVGHSHGFDLPYLTARSLIDSGEFGAVKMIHALNCTDYLYRPRRPEELVTAEGGGAVFNQAPHQVEIVRLLAGSAVASVRAVTGTWDPARPTEGAYTALLTFRSGTVASLAYNGYGHFDSDMLASWIGEMGHAKDPSAYGQARRALRKIIGPDDEAAFKDSRAYGGIINADAARAASLPLAYNHFGDVLVACEHGTLRPFPDRVEIYGNDAKRIVSLPPPTVPRREVIDEFVAAVRGERLPLHSAREGMETLATCLAILRSSAEQCEVWL